MHIESSAELKPGYEQVFSVTEYYDGPRKGVANYNGRPYFFDCIFFENADDYSNMYRLTPISLQTLELVKEGWDIWRRWELAFHTGKVTKESHPSLPHETKRYKEINAVLAKDLKTDIPTCVTRIGMFEVVGTPELPAGVMRPLQVIWTEIA